MNIGRIAFVTSTGLNQFIARATGGVTFWTAIDPTTGAPTVGANLASGSGSWSSVSDRNVKANFSAVDGPALLAKIAALPISTWNYKAQPSSVRHLGPMAQDFRSAFGLGEDDKHISTVDADGVALAGIQALYQLLQERDKQLEQLKQDRDKQIQQLKLDRDKLAASLAQLEARLEKVERTKER